MKNIKYKWAIISQTPVPRKSFSSGLVLQIRAQTSNSRVFFCFRFRAVARNESVRRTLGTRRSLAPRVEFLGRAWSAPPSAGPSDKEKPSSAACVFRWAFPRTSDLLPIGSNWQGRSQSRALLKKDRAPSGTAPLRGNAHSAMHKGTLLGKGACTAEPYLDRQGSRMGRHCSGTTLAVQRIKVHSQSRALLAKEETRPRPQRFIRKSWGPCSWQKRTQKGHK